MSEPAALDLALVKRRMNAASEGPWEWDDDGFLTVGHLSYAELSAADAYFIAQSREWVPALVDELERCRAERDALCVALERIRDYSYLAGEGLPRAIAREALGEVTQ